MPAVADTRAGLDFGFEKTVPGFFRENPEPGLFIALWSDPIALWSDPIALGIAKSDKSIDSFEITA
jgi:hypothetical protein